MAAEQTTPPPASAPRPGPLPSFSTLTIPPSLSRFDVPAREYVSGIGQPWDGIAVGALIFAPGPRVLLIQRAKTDSLPEKWEIPSGVVSNDPQADATVTRAVARELWEEAGLTAKGLIRLVAAPADGEEGPQTVDDGFVFSNSTKSKVFCRYVFEVDVEDHDGGMEVKLNPFEHQDFVWATEDEVRDLRIGKDKREIELTSEHLRRLILEGFKLQRE